MYMQYGGTFSAIQQTAGTALFIPASLCRGERVEAIKPYQQKENRCEYCGRKHDNETHVCEGCGANL